MSRIQFNPAFVRTKNVRNFEMMMDSLSLADGEGRFGLVWGQAGRGKTRTATWWHANHRSTYLQTRHVWRTSEGEFLFALAKELGVTSPARRKGPVFAQVADHLARDPQPVFIDEIERMPPGFLEIVRDLTNITGAPFVLIGEDELVTAMRRNRRVWSRVYQQLHFIPITASDIICYVRDTTGLQLSPEVAAILEKGHATAGIDDGNFRIVKRAVIPLVEIANVSRKNGDGGVAITAKMAQEALRYGLSGR